MIYIVILLISLLGTFVLRRSNKGSQTLFYFTFIIILFVICSFKDKTVGADTLAYIESFDEARDEMGYFLITPELIYKYLLLGIAKLASSYTGCFLAFYFIIFFAITCVFFQHSKSPLNSLCLYALIYPFFFLQSLNILRQAVAIPFVMLFICTWERKKIISLLFLVVACLIHFTSIFSLVFVLLGSLPVKLTKIKLYIILIFLFVIGLFGGIPLDGIASYIPGYSGANEGLEFLSGKMDRYTTYYESNNLTSFFFTSIPLVIYTTTLFEFRNIHKLYYDIVMYVTFSNFLLVQSIGNLDRVIMSPLAILLILIPNIESMRLNKNQRLKIGLVKGFMIIYYLLCVFHLSYYIYPYKFVFE